MWCITFAVSYVCFCVCMRSGRQSLDHCVCQNELQGGRSEGWGRVCFLSLVLYRRMWDTCGTPSARNAEHLVLLLHLIFLRLQALALYKVLVKVTHVKLVLEDGKCKPDSLTNEHIA